MKAREVTYVDGFFLTRKNPKKLPTLTMSDVGYGVTAALAAAKSNATGVIVKHQAGVECGKAEKLDDVPVIFLTADIQTSQGRAAVCNAIGGGVDHLYIVTDQPDDFDDDEWVAAALTMSEHNCCEAMWNGNRIELVSTGPSFSTVLTKLQDSLGDNAEEFQ